MLLVGVLFGGGLGVRCVAVCVIPQRVQVIRPLAICRAPSDALVRRRHGHGAASCASGSCRRAFVARLSIKHVPCTVQARLWWRFPPTHGGHMLSTNLSWRCVAAICYIKATLGKSDF